MSSDYTWVCHNAEANFVESLAAAQRFPTQAEAEAWLGDEWPQLAQDGVAQVTLVCGDEPVYGPMSLSA